MKSRNTVIAFGAALALILAAACTKKQQSPEIAAAPPAAPATQAEAPAKPDGKTEAIELGTDGDNLYFDKKSLNARAGSTVKLTFENNSKTMSHNWILAKPGTDAQVAQDGMTAGEASNWVQDGPDVIAHTKLIAPGQSDTITFTAPPAGDYTYICTYPGHNATMRGEFHSK